MGQSLMSSELQKVKNLNQEHVCNPGPWEAEAGKLKVTAQPKFLSKFLREIEGWRCEG